MLNVLANSYVSETSIKRNICAVAYVMLEQMQYDCLNRSDALEVSPVSLHLVLDNTKELWHGQYKLFSLHMV